MGLLELVVAVLVLAWLAGVVFHVAGGFIHILLLIAAVVFLARFFRTRTI